MSITEPTASLDTTHADLELAAITPTVAEIMAAPAERGSRGLGLAIVALVGSISFVLLMVGLGHLLVWLIG